MYYKERMILSNAGASKKEFIDHNEVKPELVSSFLVHNAHLDYLGD